MIVEVNDEAIKKVAEVLPKNFQPYNFSVEAPEGPITLILNYLGAVVALDYGFWRINGKQFVADYFSFNGETLKGASYLWRIARTKLEEDPEFFTATKLANLSFKEFITWITDDKGNTFKDPEQRYWLLRDYGLKLLQLADGLLHNIYRQARGELGPILLKLENFAAYRDFPLFKKAHLLCKITSRRGFWKLKETKHFPKLPPIDYHLMNLAWKLQLVTVPKPIEKYFINYQPIPEQIELLFRWECAKAYRKLAELSQYDPYILDDIFWRNSRMHCQNPPYNCSQCLFKNVCPSKNGRKVGFPVVETYRY